MKLKFALLLSDNRHRQSRTKINIRNPTISNKKQPPTATSENLLYKHTTTDIRQPTTNTTKDSDTRQSVVHSTADIRQSGASNCHRQTQKTTNNNTRQPTPQQPTTNNYHRQRHPTICGHSTTDNQQQTTTTDKHNRQNQTLPDNRQMIKGTRTMGPQMEEKILFLGSHYTNTISDRSIVKV